MDQENFMCFENNDKSYTMVDLYTNKRFSEYKDFNNYYDIDADKVLLFKKSNNEYIIRYNDVIKMEIIPQQLKIKNFYGELRTDINNNRVTNIHNDDKKLFFKCREIWNKIAELEGINNAQNFVKTTEDNGDEYIAVDVHKNTSFVEGNSFIFCY